MGWIMAAEWWMVILTGVMVVFTGALFFWQKRQFDHDKRVHNANYKLALFDHRMKVYFAIEECLAEFMREGGPPVSSIVKLRWEARNASFLLPDVPLGFIDEIVEKGFEHRRAHDNWEPLRARAYEGETLSSEEGAKKQESLKKMHELEGWFMQQIEKRRLKTDFEPYLKLPDKL